MKSPLVKVLMLCLVETSLLAQPAGNAKVQVFLLAGQSNMQGYGRVAIDPQRGNDGAGTLERLASGPDSKRFRHLLAPDGGWARRDDVHIWFLARQGRLSTGYGASPAFIGPELQFGHVVGDSLPAPVLLIKTAWGGKSLAIDFRPPSSGRISYPLNEKLQAQIDREPQMVGKYYRQMLTHVREVLADLATHVPDLAGQECELAGIGWHQGWNDRIDDRFNGEYEQNLANLIRDLRKDLQSPLLPFVIAETGMNGPDETHPRALSLMKAQAAVAEHPEFSGNVAFVGTRSLYRPPDVSPANQGYHWNQNAETYFLIGDAMGRAMLQLIDARRRIANDYRIENLEGWTLHLSPALLEKKEQATRDAVELLREQLRQIARVVPAAVVAQLQQVPLWFSPPYEGFRPTAEYHPDPGWLRKHGRNPAMAKAVEFTNIDVFAAECRRMPMLALHELAHAYHDRVLGFEHEQVQAVYQQAKNDKLYDAVKRHDGRIERAYAMTNAKEYFAECSEAFFGRNDFFPFDRTELQQHDPEMFGLLTRLWKLRDPP